MSIDETRHDRLPGDIDLLGARRYPDLVGRSHQFYAAVPDDNSPALDGGLAGSIDDASADESFRAAGASLLRRRATSEQARHQAKSEDSSIHTSLAKFVSSDERLAGSGNQWLLVPGACVLFSKADGRDEDAVEPCALEELGRCRVRPIHASKDPRGTKVPCGLRPAPQNLFAIIEIESVRPGA